MIAAVVQDDGRNLLAIILSVALIGMFVYLLISARR